MGSSWYGERHVITECHTNALSHCQGRRPGGFLQSASEDRGLGIECPARALTWQEWACLRGTCSYSSAAFAQSWPATPM